VALPADAPTLRLRARVLGGLTGTWKVLAEFGPSSVYNGITEKTFTDGNWSDWLAFDATAIGTFYATFGMGRYPVRLGLRFTKPPNGAEIELELDWDAEGEASVYKTFHLLDYLYEANLADPNGPFYHCVLWVDRDGDPATGTPRARLCWEANEPGFSSVSDTPVVVDPSLLIVDRLYGDDARETWEKGCASFKLMGVNCLHLPPAADILEIAQDAGITLFATDPSYNTPGGYWEFGDQINNPTSAAAVATWAAAAAAEFPADLRASIKIAAIRDEPLISYKTQSKPPASPSTTRDLAWKAAYEAALPRFRAYLRAQGLSLSDIGAESWDDVEPIFRGEASDLPGKRLFYWSMRWFSREMSAHANTCSQALNEAFGSVVRPYTNWNTYHARFFTPGPAPYGPAHADYGTEQASTGCDDWWEYAQLNPGGMLWAEDWWADGLACWQSFQGAKLRCAARSGGVPWGAYIVGLAGGQREQGCLQKVLCLAAAGATVIYQYGFGPEDLFNGNSYSNQEYMAGRYQEAAGYLAFADTLYGQGTRAPAPVALLFPRAAQVWDAHGNANPSGIASAAAFLMDEQTLDYWAELFGLYYALLHAGYPVEILHEDEVTLAGLADYRALYVTTPCLDAGRQGVLKEWVTRGGYLALTSGACWWDEYREPCTVLSDFTGIRETERAPGIMGGGRPASVGTVSYLSQTPTIRRAEGTLSTAAGTTVASRDDGAAALLKQTLGLGRVYHYTYLPGLSYWASSNVYDRSASHHPSGFDATLRALCVLPVTDLGLTWPVAVGTRLVEWGLTEADTHAALTLCNWTNSDLESVAVTVQAPRPVESVTSKAQGALAFTWDGAAVTFALPLGAADVVRLVQRPALPPSNLKPKKKKKSVARMGGRRGRQLRRRYSHD
jgi:hypothetical protein